MKYHYIEQNTPEWDKLRLGRFTASSADKLLSAESTKGYQGLISRIVEEQYTHEKTESGGFSGNVFTERGHALEQDAINSFEFENGKYTVGKVGFVEVSEYIGCSPDGLIGDDSLIQVKCPIFTTQEDYLSKVKVPNNYYKQMQFEMLCTNTSSNWFYSYHPILSSVCIEVHRDKEMIIEIAKRLRKAINQVELRLRRLNNGY
jgi:hypothetical protein